jgi:predicted alternative tryptophan synthase beta-subunit
LLGGSSGCGQLASRAAWRRSRFDTNQPDGAQAYYNKQEGIQRLTTETGAGQWGTAIALACTMLDLGCTVSMVKTT